MLLAALVGFVLVFPVRTGTTAAGGRWALVGLFDMPPLPRLAVSLAVIFLLTVGDADGAGAGGGPDVRDLRAAGGLPPRHRRLACSASSPSPALSFLRLPPLALGRSRRAGVRRAAGRPGRTALARGRHRCPGADARRSSPCSGSFQWSPYYKIHTQDAAGGNVRIEVNNTPLQTAASGGGDQPRLAVLPLPLHVCRVPRRRARHRRGHGQRRGRRPAQGRAAGRRRRDRPRPRADRPRPASRTGRTPTRG